MKTNLQSIGVASLALGLCSLCGCGFLVSLVQSNNTTVRLVNDGAFPVEVKLYVSSQQDIPEILITAGDRETYTVDAGETYTFTRKCDDLQAIIIDDANLIVIGDIGPDTGTDVLRDGDDFDCGDTITFTFDHSDLLLDFSVAVSFQHSTLGN